MIFIINEQIIGCVIRISLKQALLFNFNLIKLEKHLFEHQIKQKA